MGEEPNTLSIMSQHLMASHLQTLWATGISSSSATETSMLYWGGDPKLVALLLLLLLVSSTVQSKWNNCSYISLWTICKFLQLELWTWRTYKWSSSDRDTCQTGYTFIYLSSIYLEFVFDFGTTTVKYGNFGRTLILAKKFNRIWLLGKWVHIDLCVFVFLFLRRCQTDFRSC
jgi:hypothetical protein